MNKNTDLAAPKDRPVGMIGKKVHVKVEKVHDKACISMGTSVYDKHSLRISYPLIFNSHQLQLPRGDSWSPASPLESQQQASCVNWGGPMAGHKPIYELWNARPKQD